MFLLHHYVIAQQTQNAVLALDDLFVSTVYL